MFKKTLLSTGIGLLIIGSGTFISVKQFTCIPIFGCYTKQFEIRLNKREVELLEGLSFIIVGTGLTFLTAGLIRNE
jgi:hypothetical protein